MPIAPLSHARQVSRLHKTMYERGRLSSTARGYDARWRKYRLIYLAKHPLCVECKGQTVAATVVDHIIRHQGDMKLFWDPSNHQSLCETHHNRKTAKEIGWGK